MLNDWASVSKCFTTNPIVSCVPSTLTHFVNYTVAADL